MAQTDLVTWRLIDPPLRYKSSPTRRIRAWRRPNWEKSSTLRRRRQIRQPRLTSSQIEELEKAEVRNCKAKKLREAEEWRNRNRRKAWKKKAEERAKYRKQRHSLNSFPNPGVSRVPSSQPSISKFLTRHAAGHWVEQEAVEIEDAAELSNGDGNENGYYMFLIEEASATPNHPDFDASEVNCGSQSSVHHHGQFTFDRHSEIKKESAADATNAQPHTDLITDGNAINTDLDGCDHCSRDPESSVKQSSPSQFYHPPHLVLQQSHVNPADRGSTEITSHDTWSRFTTAQESAADVLAIISTQVLEEMRFDDEKNLSESDESFSTLSLSETDLEEIALWESKAS